MFGRFLSILLLSCTLASCLSVSSPEVTQTSAMAAHQSVLAASLEKSVDSNKQVVIKNYEMRPSLPDRLQYLSAAGAPAFVGTDDPVNASQPPATTSDSVGRWPAVNRLGHAMVLLLRSERWQDVLDESAQDWNRCLVDASLHVDGCRTLGHARAVAFVRLGHLRDALMLFESLSTRQLSSHEALLFAGLLADAGSMRLCARLAGIGLQWEPSDVRAELFALQAKCLRLDGQVEQARSAMTRALAEFPNMPSLQLESAVLFLSERNLTQGCDLLERLYLQEFKDVAVFYNWGKCLIGRRESAAARTVLKNARTHWPSERLWLLFSGEVSFLEGNTNAARRDGLDYLAAAPAGDVFRPHAEGLIRNAQGE